MMGLPGKGAETYFFYRQVIGILNRNFVPFLLGGGFAFEFYTRTGRSTKDMDIFVAQKNVQRVFEALDNAGFLTELTFPHWLGKVFHGELFIDLIFSSGNGLCDVDDIWFEHAVPGQVFGFPIKFCPVEEMIWSKAFIMERERYDGGDIAHLLLKCGHRLSWNHLVNRFGSHWRVLLSHLLLFGYIYPSERLLVPPTILRGLLDQLNREIDTTNTANLACQGPLLSRTQFRVDIEKLGYKDARLPPEGKMSVEEAVLWTEAAEAKAENESNPNGQ
jgi:hypothetical protein